MSVIAVAAKWSTWGRMLAIAQLALAAKRHLGNLTPPERRELGGLVAASKGRPGNLTVDERARFRELVSKLEPGAFARNAAQTAVPLRRKR